MEIVTTHDATTSLPVAMTVAGSDSGGGAGIQADLPTFTALGVHGTSAVTCLTAQNPESVTSILPADPAFVLEQMRQIARGFDIAALKTGMLYSAEIIRAVGGFLEKHPDIPAVIDPVMVATSGAALLKDDAIRALSEILLPRAALITPNLDEAAVLLGERPDNPEAMIEAGRSLHRRFGCAVLIKGGHLEGDRVADALVANDNAPKLLEYPRVSGIDTHGSGCMYSAAITAFLARGLPLDEAVGAARAFLQKAFEHPKTIENRRFLNPFAKRES